MIRYFDELKGASVAEHYESTECIIVNAENLFQEFVTLFLGDNISWNNLVSDLYDSTNYMRGKKVDWELSFMKRHLSY